MVEGQTLSFTLFQYDSIMSIISRMRRNKQGLFKTRKTKETVEVTCLETAQEKVFDRVAAARKLKDKIEDLNWRASQFDPEAEEFELILVCTRNGKTRSTRYACGRDFPVLAKALSGFLEYKLDYL